MSSQVSLRDALTAGIGLLTGLVLGNLTPRLLRIPRRSNPAESGLGSDNDASGPMSAESQKLILCVRTDLGMKRGKIAAQAGHATLGAYKAAARQDKEALRAWERDAQPKIALQISSAREATRLQNEARARGLVTYVVYDAGRTQIAAGSMTVLAVGPGPISKINQVTGALKLL